MLNYGTFNSIKYNSTRIVEIVTPEEPVGGGFFDKQKKKFKLQYFIIGKKKFEFVDLYIVIGKRKINLNNRYNIFAIKKIKFNSFLNGSGKSKHSQLLKLKCRANKQFGFGNKFELSAKRQYLINEKILFCGKNQKQIETKILIKARKDITNILEALDLID